MKKMLSLVALLSLGFAPAVFAVDAGGVVISHYESLQGLSLQAGQVHEAGKSAHLSFDAFGRHFELHLQPNERLLSQVFQGRSKGNMDVYRGSLAGRDGSWVRLVVSNGVPTGLVWDGEQMLAIERGAKDAAAIIYRLQDAYFEPGLLSCGNLGKATDFAAVYGKITTEVQSAVINAAVATEELNIGLIGDYEFTDSMGANAEAALITRINNVDGIFSEQLGVQITAREVQTFTDPDDPFTASVPNDLLSELSTYRLRTPAQTAQGISFMFTGRDLDGTTAGVAFTDALCNSRFGAGLAEGWRGVTTDSLVAAHEIGHLFGAPHDGEPGSLCESVTGSFLMAPSVNGSNQFSTCSIDIMRPNADAASCITPLPEADVSVALAGAAPELLLGDSATLNFDVTSNGTAEATNVGVSFVMPANLTLGAVTPTTGSCSSGAGQVDCVLGAIASMGSERIALVVTAAAVGTETLNASATADADANQFNNAQALQVVVNPAIDLRVESGAATAVFVNDAVTVRPTVANVSSLAASNIEVSVSFSSGLRVDGANWADGTCTIDANAVTCQRASLAAQAEVTIDLQLTATAVGSQSYTATVTASEVDRDGSSNSVTGTVTVSAVGTTPIDSDSGGGGAVSLFGLALIALIQFGRNRRLDSFKYRAR